MTEIAFHFNVENRLAYLCRLLRKAVAGGAKLVVTGQNDDLQQLDLMLWTFSPTDFVPHCAFEVNDTLRKNSAVILASKLDSTLPGAIVVNLGESVPVGFERHQRVIEIVTGDVMNRKLARARWKFYADAGYQLVQHDLQKATA